LLPRGRLVCARWDARLGYTYAADGTVQPSPATMQMSTLGVHPGALVYLGGIASVPPVGSNIEVTPKGILDVV
jgi:hypothetical protein